MDLCSTNVLSWKPSNSLDNEFALVVLEMVLEGGWSPEVFHSDQNSQFTSANFVNSLQTATVRMSWSARRREYDNILGERLLRTVTYEEVYMRTYIDGWGAEISLARFL